MNLALLTDPVVLISAGVILIGVFALFWAIGKFKRLGAESSDPPVDDLIASLPPSPDTDFRAPAFASPAPVASVPEVGKDVADRLETMSARLAEMQTVLMKQSAAPTVGAAGTPGGVGQGFSPETIDKLLKIIGNVIQQVDVLQKSLNLTK